MANQVKMNANPPSIKKSDELFKRGQGLIPAHTQTLAKGPEQHVNGAMPKYAARGAGARIWDVDGNEYLDYQMAIGPLSLGYAYGPVDDAIRAQLKDGITFSLPHSLEVEVAELIREVIPNAESVRFSKTGADATSAAVRLARAFTGREKVLCCGYHGWHDWYIAVTDRNRGIPKVAQELSYTVNFNDLEQAAQSIDDQTACVILEPMVFEEPKPGYLQGLKELCEKHGALLIFDEMWTGFRFALGGAQERWGVKADLSTYSKAIANGMPISVLAGRQDVMKLLNKDVFFFTTFGGEALSLAAAKTTIHELRKHNVPAYLDKLGKTLKDGYNTIAREMDLTFTRAVGANCRSMVVFDASAGDPLVTKSFVQQEMGQCGILWSGFHNLSFSHTEKDVAYTLDAYREVLKRLKTSLDQKTTRSLIRGELVAPVFRRTSNFNMKPGNKS